MITYYHEKTKMAIEGETGAVPALLRIAYRWIWGYLEENEL